MIWDAIQLIRDRLNGALLAGTDPSIVGSVEDQVVVPEGSAFRDSVEFKLGAVTLLLVRLEEERTLRRADPYARIGSEGGRVSAVPEVRLNLYLLVVSHFPSYAQSLRNLGSIIRHFQANRVLNHGNAPDLGRDIDQLVFELVTPTFAEQNEIWGTLRTAARPSVLYRVRMIIFESEEGSGAPGVSDSRVHVEVRA